MQQTYRFSLSTEAFHYRQIPIMNNSFDSDKSPSRHFINVNIDFTKDHQIENAFEDHTKAKAPRCRNTQTIVVTQCTAESEITPSYE